MAPGLSAIALLLLLLSASVVTDSATIYGIQPNRGSIAGGTYLTVWGTGFARSGREGKTRV
jgi:hypothetical protein